MNKRKSLDAGLIDRATRCVMRRLNLPCSMREDAQQQCRFVIAKKLRHLKGKTRPSFRLLVAEGLRWTAHWARLQARQRCDSLEVANEPNLPAGEDEGSGGGILEDERQAQSQADADLRRDLREAIATLPRSQQQVIQATYIDKEPIDACCRRLRLCRAQYDRLLGNARSRLIKLFED